MGETKERYIAKTTQNFIKTHTLNETQQTRQRGNCGHKET